jgi:hypothetical protein
LQFKQKESSFFFPAQSLNRYLMVPKARVLPAQPRRPLFWFYIIWYLIWKFSSDENVIVKFGRMSILQHHKNVQFFA